MKSSLLRFFSIVKHELFNYAINPATYFGALFFLFSLAINFFFGRNFFVVDQGSTDVRFFFLFIPYISILYIPILTINTWQSNDEILDLLPVGVFVKVFSKWLATLIVFSLCLFLSLLIPLSVILFGDLNVSRLICGFFGMLLFASAALSFGQWASHITKNNLAAFVITVFFLIVVNIIHLLPRSFFLPDVVLSICNFFSFSWHFSAAAQGIIDTRDIFFFIFVTLFFLLQSGNVSEKDAHSLFSKAPRKMQNKRFNKSAVFLLGVLLLNSQLFYKRIDTTAEKQFSLAPITKELLKTLPENLEITYYLSGSLKNLYPQTRDVQDLLSECADFSSSVSFKVIDPEDEKIKENIKNAGLLSEQIKLNKKNETTIADVFSGVILECGSQTEIIPFVLSTTAFEYSIDSALQKFSSGVGRSVYILCGGKGTLESTFEYIPSWLASSGFSYLEVTSDQIIDTQKIDLRSPLLVLGNSELSVDEVSAIERFAMLGGRVCFAVSPIVVDMSKWEVTPLFDNPLIQMLDNWGFSIKNSLIQDKSNYKIVMSQQDSDVKKYVEYPFWVVTKKNNTSGTSILAKSFTGLEFYWPTPMEIFSTKDFLIQPILQTSSQSWLQNPSVENESFFSTDPFNKNNVIVDKSSTAKYIVVVTGVGKIDGWSVTGYSESTQIVVFSNQYFPSSMISYTNSSYNLDFLVNSLLWLNGEDELLSVKTKGSVVTNLYKVSNTTQMAQYEKLVLLFLTFVFLFVVFGVALLVTIVRRKKKRFYYG